MSSGNSIRRRLTTFVGALGITLGLITVADGTPAPSLPATAAAATSPAPDRTAGPKNVIWILVDDFSWDLLPYMNQVRAMRRNGVTFDNYYVADSLCCPSRATMFTGRYPHNTGVRTNKGSNGGYRAWQHRHPHGVDNEHNTFAVAARKRGYHTGFIGKFLNGFGFRAGDRVPRQPGWNYWRPYNGSGYQETSDYAMPAANGVAETGSSYATDHMKTDALDYLRARTNGSRRQPFLLEVATYAPHSAVADNYRGRHFPPAPRDLPKTTKNPRGQFAHGDCGRRAGKRVDCYDVRIENLAGNRHINCADRFDRVEMPRARPRGGNTPCELQQYLRDRIRMVQPVNDLIRSIRRELTAKHLWDNTYLVFSSDNGFHLGQQAGHVTQRGGGAGKGSAFETDINVPLVVEGGDGMHGVTRHELVQNTDLGTTFLDMQPDRRPAGRTPRLRHHDGRSLLGLITDPGKPLLFRNWAYVEHTSNAHSSKRTDPDAERSTMQKRSYQALRTGNELFVRYPNGDRPTRFAYFTVRKTPHGRLDVRRNWSKLNHDRRDQVVTMFRTFRRCHGGWILNGDPPQAMAHSCQLAGLQPSPPG